MKETCLNYSNTVVFASLKEALSHDFECLYIEEQLTACTVLFNQEGGGCGRFTIPAGYLLVVLVLKYALEELYEVLCFRWVTVWLKGHGIAGACRVVLWHNQCVVVSNAIQCAPSWNFHIVLCCCKLVRLFWPSGGQASPGMFEPTAARRFWVLASKKCRKRRVYSVLGASWSRNGVLALSVLPIPEEARWHC